MSGIINIKRKPYCLVLGGGGSKGIYQMGVWQALREDHIRLEAIIGTSVGAINAAFMISSDFNKVMDGWVNLGPHNVFSLPPDIKGRFGVFKEMTRQIMTKGGVDTTRFRQFLSNYIDESTIRKSKCDFGIVTFRVNDLKPVEYFIDDIPQGELMDYVMASAGLPGLQPNIIDHKLFADGGFYDVIPYNTARKRGYNRIIAVDISGIGHDRKDHIDGAETVFVKNSQDTKDIITFDKETYSRNIRMGYLDTRKAFGHYNSYKYFFRLTRRMKRRIDKALTSDKGFAAYSKYLMLDTDADTSRDNRLRLVRDILPAEYKISKYPEAVLTECAAEILGIDTLLHDNIIDLIGEISRRLDEVSEDDYIQNVKTKFHERMQRITKIFNASMDGKELLSVMMNDDTALKYLKIVMPSHPNLVPALVFCSILEYL